MIKRGYQAYKKKQYFLTLTLSLVSTCSAHTSRSQNSPFIRGEKQKVGFWTCFVGHPLWSAYTLVCLLQGDTKVGCKDAQT